VAPTRRLGAVLCAFALLACAGQRAAVGPAPASPDATVGQFLAAVNAADLGRMAELFGDERGPSTVTIRSAVEREQRIAIMQRLLWSDSFRVLGAEPVPGTGRRLLRVELARGVRRIPVPFTVAPQRAGGWLLAVIDLNPVLPSPGSRPSP
jgi:hypothetical protein